MRSMGQNPTEDEVLNLVIGIDPHHIVVMVSFRSTNTIFFEEFDVNGDGTIDFDEFLEMMRKQAEQQDNSAELREAFKIFDRDGNGYIDAAELKKVNSSSSNNWFICLDITIIYYLRLLLYMEKDCL